MEQRTLSFNLTTKAFLLLCVGTFSLLGVAMTTVLAGSGLKMKVVVALFAVLPIVAHFFGSLKDVLLFCWVGSLTYNRQFFVFGFTERGAQDFYWVLGDLFFGALLMLWLLEAMQTHRYRPVSTPRSALWPYFLPFGCAALLSILAAQRVDWTLIELTRYVRFALILWYVSRNVGVHQWWIIVSSLCCAMAAQSMIAMKEIVTGQSGLLGEALPLDRLGSLADEFTQVTFYGSVRATGTMNHPPNLASFLTLVIPVALGLSLTFKEVKLRLLAGLFFVAGVAGLAATLSRVPWLMTAVAIVLVFLGLTVLREVSLKQSLGLLAVGVFASCIMLIPVRDRLVQRLTGDFDASVDQREEGIRAALSLVASESPIIGIGLNNTRLFIKQYLPEISWLDETEQFLVEMNVRALATMGNAFSYVAVETGMVGILTFALLLVGTFIIGWRACVRTTGTARAVSLGLTVGWLGILGGQLVDHSIFVDSLLYVMAIVFALLNVTPGLFGQVHGNGGIEA